jgi:osmotically-inducible protein OsmY
VTAVSSQIEVRSAGLAGRGDRDIAWTAAKALSWNTLLPRDRIRVEVSGGWVTLEGSVDWRFQKTSAEESLANLAGVRGITNLIAVSPVVPARELKAQIEDALKRSGELDASRVVVEAAGDRVTLWGCLESWGHREAAERIAWSAAGVSDVANHITVEACLVAGA